MKDTLLLFAALLALPESQGFVLVPHNARSSNEQQRLVQQPRNCPRASSSFQLQATKKKKGKPKGSSNSQASQGFGSSSSSSTNKQTKKGAEDDDYKCFPRLDPEVQQTLIGSTDVLYDEPGILPQEVYDRLDQIYGFGNFNSNSNEKHLKNEEKEESPVSLQDLLMSGNDKDEAVGTMSLLSSDKPVNSDLESLISAAAGESPAGNKNQGVVDSKRLDLSPMLEKLAPFEGFRVLHFDPLVIAIDDFFTPEECDRYVALSSGGSSDKILQSRSPTVGKDASSRSQRTSTTWYHYYESVPELMAKAAKLIGLPSISRWEEPQTVRYRRTEKFTWHLDALGPDENRPKKGGQRVATLLVYLTDLSEEDGGATMFRDLQSPRGERLAVRPKKGSGLLFFPAAGGIPNVPFDIRTLHCGQAVSSEAENDKWIAQLWLCQNDYVPTAPAVDNLHSKAFDAIAEYCGSNFSR